MTTTATTTRATIGTGSAIHLVIDGRSLCGRDAADAKSTRSKATCGTCLKRSAAAAVAPKAATTDQPAAPAKAAAPKRAPKVTDAAATAPEPIVSARTLAKAAAAFEAAGDDAAVVPVGARRLRFARSTGALVASVLSADAGIDTGDDAWATICVTHSTILAARTRRDAAAMLSHSEDFCDACRAIADARTATA